MNIRRFSYECIICDYSVFVRTESKYGITFTRKRLKFCENGEKPRKMAKNREKSQNIAESFARKPLKL